MTNKLVYETMNWETYGRAMLKLANQIKNDRYQPEAILAIARGGLFCAGSLGYALSIKNIYLINCEHYTGEDERLPMPVMLPPYLKFVDQHQSKILIAEDVADTGHTLKLVRDICLEQVGEVRVAVLYEKPQSLVKCEYVWKNTDKWINFPWSGQTSNLKRMSPHARGNLPTDL